MKSLVLVLSLVAASSSFAAYEASEDNVTYIAWCEQNNVMVLDTATQQAKVLVNCSETQSTCKVFSSYRGFGEVVTAKCEK
jgi:hypothetical protein